MFRKTGVQFYRGNNAQRLVKTVKSLHLPSGSGFGTATVDICEAACGRPGPRGHAYLKALLRFKRAAVDANIQPWGGGGGVTTASEEGRKGAEVQEERERNK